MAEPKMPDLAAQQFRDISEQHTRELIAFLVRWPNFRMHVAYALLGEAVATVDMMGGDADGWLRELRTRTKKPAPLSPPEGS